MKQAEVWKKGLPYGPDVRRLEEAFPKPEEGQIITHGEFETVLGLERGTQRYYGVIDAWRSKLFRERGIDTAWEQGEGLKILEPSERLSVSESDARKSMRGLGRSVRRLVSTPRERLDGVGQQRYDHQVLALGKLKAFADDTRKQLAVDLAPVKSLPKPRLIKTGTE